MIKRINKRTLYTLVGKDHDNKEYKYIFYAIKTSSKLDKIYTKGYVMNHYTKNGDYEFKNIDSPRGKLTLSGTRKATEEEINIYYMTILST